MARDPQMVADEPRTWFLPEADPVTAARQLHDGLEMLRQNVWAYRERRMRMERVEPAPPPATGH